MQRLSDPIFAALRVSAFLHALNARRFFPAAEILDKSVFFSLLEKPFESLSSNYALEEEMVSDLEVTGIAEAPPRILSNLPSTASTVQLAVVRYPAALSAFSSLHNATALRLIAAGESRSREFTTTLSFFAVMAFAAASNASIPYAGSKEIGFNTNGIARKL